VCAVKSLKVQVNWENVQVNRGIPFWELFTAHALMSISVEGPEFLIDLESSSIDQRGCIGIEPFPSHNQYRCGLFLWASSTASRQSAVAVGNAINAALQRTQGKALEAGAGDKRFQGLTPRSTQVISRPCPSRSKRCVSSRLKLWISFGTGRA
jgi:hypothetical protein